MADNIKVDEAIVDSVKFAKLIGQTYGRSSLTRNAKDTIAQYPVIFSADIPTEDAVVVAKSLEAQYAALLVSLVSVNSDYDRSRFKNPSDYLKTFYNNKNVPPILMSMDAQLPDDEFIGEFAVESATIYPDLDRLIPSHIAMECWADSDDQFNQTSINSCYRPESWTQKAMEQVVGKLRELHMPAMEGTVDEVLNNMGVGSNRYNGDDVGAPTKADRVSRTEEKGVYQTDEKGKVVVDPRTNKPVRVTKVTDNKVLRAPAATGAQGFNTYNDKLGSMAPTMVNLQLTSHHGNAPVITHNVVVGVKAMVRTVPQDLMISNLAEGVNDTRRMFKFIKWTEGEYRFIRDFILGIDEAKLNASSNRDMQKWLSGLKRRKRADLISKMTTGMPLPPMVTIVATSYEIAKVQEMTGLDLNDAYNAAKLISKYYLLGFIIYESESGRIKAIFDGDTNFSVSTISGLKTKQQKDQDLVQYAQFIRAANRM